MIASIKKEIENQTPIDTTRVSPFSLSVTPFMCWRRAVLSKMNLLRMRTLCIYI